MASWKKVIVSGSKAVLAEVTASAGFSGDGSNLTGVQASGLDIDALSAVTSLHQTEDTFVVSDNGTEKKITFTNVEDAIFGNVSGDATIAAGGALTLAADSVENSMLANITRGSVKVGGASDAPTDLDAKTSGQILVGDGTDIASVAVSGDIALAANGAMTIQANSVALGTDTTGNYVGTITGGSGITSTGATSGEGIGHSLSVDLSGLSSHTIGAASSTITMGDKVIITGDLEIRGSQVAVSSSNLVVADQFALFNSGSTSGDGGIVVQTGASGVGTALAYDDSAVRWGLSEVDGTAHDATTFTPRQYVVSVSGSSVDPVEGSNPANFGASTATRVGMMHVNTTNGDVFIWS